MIIRTLFTIILSISTFNTSYAIYNKQISQSIDKEFYEFALNLVDKNEYESLIKYCNDAVADKGGKAEYFQFLGIGFLLKYEDASMLNIWKDSYIESAIVAFKRTKKLDYTYEDKADAGIIGGLLILGKKIEAEKLFKKSFANYPQSIHLNYIGIKLHEELGNKIEKEQCESFVLANDPTYGGKPVFDQIVKIHLFSLIKMFVTVIVATSVATLTAIEAAKN